MDSRYGHQWHELLFFKYFGTIKKQIWHAAKEVTIILMNVFIGLKMFISVMGVFLSIDILRSGTNPADALERINPIGDGGYFHYLKPCSREKNLTGKSTTVELCDSDTNLVVLK